MYCYKCGKEVEEGTKFCPYCGVQLDMQGASQNGYEPLPQNNYVKEDDAPSGGFAFLSFLIPIVGVVLYIVWHKEYPLKAKSCLKGIIVGFVLEIVMFCCMATTIGGLASDDHIDDYTHFDTIVETVSYE